MADTPTVTKPFTTPLRRFQAGQPVTPADIDGPLSFEDRVKLGQISEPAKKPAGKDKAAPTTADAGDVPPTAA